MRKGNNYVKDAQRRLISDWDIYFIVRADSPEGAAELVDKQMASYATSTLKAYCEFIYVLDSTAHEPREGPVILMGPLYGLPAFYDKTEAYFRVEKPMHGNH